MKFYTKAQLCVKGWICLAPYIGAQQPVTKTAEVAPAPPTTVISTAKPEGAVLPKSVARFRAVSRVMTGTYGYDERGHKLSMGGRFYGHGGAAVGEYGLTDRLTVQLKVPFVVQKAPRFHAREFTNSSAYRSAYNKSISLVAKALAQQGQICITVSGCKQYLENGGDIPVDYRMTAPGTGENLTIRGGVSIRNQIRERIFEGALASQENSATGLGDLEVGALYNAFKTDSLSASIGLGLRFPTGGFEKVPDARIPVGGGVIDGAMRINFDYSPLEGLWLCAQTQLEQALTDGKKRQASFIDPTKLNENGGGNTSVYKKNGVEQSLLMKANYGLGALSTYLKPFAVYTHYRHENIRSQFIDHMNGQKSEYKPRAKAQYIGAGLNISALPYKIPLSFEVSYEKPVAGRNLSLAKNSLEMTAFLYMKV